MLRPLLNATLAQDYIVFFMRFIMIALLAVAIFVARGLATAPLNFTPARDILQVAAIAAGINLVFGIVVSIPVLRGNAPWVLVLVDSVTAGIFSALVTNRPYIVVAICAVFIVEGMFRLGTKWGFFHAVFVALGAVIAFVVARVTPANLVTEYAPVVILVFLIALVALVWSNAFDSANSARNIRLRSHAEEIARRLDSMRVRAKALADMGTLLNSTLSYEKILDACLDIGRFTLRDDAKQRVIAMVLLVEAEDEMVIANARGLQHLDLGRKFTGKSGMIATCVSEARTIITPEDAGTDPELGTLIAFGNIQSALIAPLRVEYNTYGVLVYASTARNAFNEDHLDTMQALGVQATIALKNAIIVDNLQQERDRLIRIERGMRESLTRDLHDIPTQTMAALAMQITTLPMLAERHPEKLKEEVEMLRGVALRFVDEMRYVMFTWRPLSLESQGLGLSLDQLAQKMQSTYKQPMKCEVDPKAVAYLIDEQQSALFYLVEEAANNARKHAKASQIRVRVSLEGSNVITRIMDNGVGFDVGAMNANYEMRSSYGMINMSDRAEYMKGTLNVTSEPGKGTTITVTVPVNINNKPTLAAATARKSFDRPVERPTNSGPLSPMS